MCREWQKMGPAQIIERAARLSIAFDRYKKLFGEECHGTIRQCAALLELVPKDAKSKKRSAKRK
mgnify:CR=1 FL=1